MKPDNLSGTCPNLSGDTLTDSRTDKGGSLDPRCPVSGVGPDNGDVSNSLSTSGSRVAGRGRLLRSLRSLQRRLDRYAIHRARTDGERRWAVRFGDAVEQALTVGIQSPAARASLAAADRRAERSAKTSTHETGLRRGGFPARGFVSPRYAAKELARGRLTTETLTATGQPSFTEGKQP